MNFRFAKVLFIVSIISKISFSQTVDWVKYYTHPPNSFYSNDIIHTTDDCYVMTGYETSIFQGGIDNYFILKFNNVGDTLWYREDGTSWDSEGKFVIETSDSCYIVCTTKAQIDMVKYDRNGNLLWEKYQIPFPGNGFQFNSLIEVNKKLYAFGTGVLSSSLDIDVMYKFDLNGDTLMTLFNTLFNSGYNRKTAINYKNDKIALSGYAYDSTAMMYQARLSIIDTNGSVITNRIIPTFQATGGYMIEENFIHGFYFFTQPNAFMIKLDSSGNVLWSKDFGIGSLYSEAIIDSNTFLLMGQGYYYIYLNDSGQLIPYNPFDYPFNGGMEVGNMIVHGNKLVMGGAGGDTVTGVGECIIAQFDLSHVTAVFESLINKKILLYPNPVTHDQGKIFLYSNNFSIKKLYVYNSFGQIVRNIETDRNSESVTQISIENFNEGIYFVEAFDEKGSRFELRFVVN